MARRCLRLLLPVHAEAQSLRVMRMRERGRRSSEARICRCSPSRPQRQIRVMPALLMPQRVRAAEWRAMSTRDAGATFMRQRFAEKMYTPIVAAGAYADVVVADMLSSPIFPPPPPPPLDNARRYTPSRYSAEIAPHARYQQLRLLPP